MVRRNKIMLSASALLALSLTTGLGTVSSAVAQQAIMLETIGAVRMVSPEELHRRDAEEALRQQQTQQARPVALPQQHAEITQ